jgi:hypothetical protein
MMKTLLDQTTPAKPVEKPLKAVEGYMRQRVADMKEKQRFRNRMYDRMIAAGHNPV